MRLQLDAANTMLQLRPTSCNYTRTGCILSELQAGRVQLQPGQSELQLVHVQLQLVHTQLQSVPSSCNWSIHPVAIDVFSRLQLQGGCILYRECTLLHFSLAHIYIDWSLPGSCEGVVWLANNFITEKTPTCYGHCFEKPRLPKTFLKKC